MCQKMVYFLSWTETQKCMFVFSQQGHTNVCLFSHSRVKSLRSTKRRTRQFSLSRVAVTYQRPRVKGVRGMKTSAGAGHSEDSSGGTEQVNTLQSFFTHTLRTSENPVRQPGTPACSTQTVSVAPTATTLPTALPTSFRVASLPVAPAATTLPKSPTFSRTSIFSGGSG